LENKGIEWECKIVRKAEASCIARGGKEQKTGGNGYEKKSKEKKKKTIRLKSTGLCGVHAEDDLGHKKAVLREGSPGEKAAGYRGRGGQSENE